MLENVKAVIFDLDGTLADSMWVWSQIDQEFFARMGWAFPDELNNEIEGMGFTETAEYFVDTFHLACTVEELKEQWNSQALEKYRTIVPMKPGAREFLNDLKKRGIPIGIASSNSHLLIRTFLQAQQIGECIDAITTSCDVQRGKPSPDVYLVTAKKLGVPPEECLVFEDVPMGILAGKNAGMRVCAVEDAYSAEQEKEKRELADFYIRDFTDISEKTYEVLL